MLNAGEIMKYYYEAKYPHALKTAKSEKEAIKQVFEKRTPKETRRAEYGPLIAKRFSVPKYDTDEISLKEFLANKGVLPLVAKISSNKETKKELKQFIKAMEVSVRMTPNKNGKFEVEEFNFESLEIDELTRIWLKADRKEKLYTFKKEEVEKQILSCSLLKEKKKLTCEYGSVSLIETLSFDIDKIYRELGMGFLIEKASVTLDDLTPYVESGVLKKQEIDQFRKLIKVEERFMILHKQTEEIQMTLLKNRTDKRRIV